MLKTQYLKNATQARDAALEEYRNAPKTNGSKNKPKSESVREKLREKAVMAGNVFAVAVKLSKAGVTDAELELLK